MKVLLSISFLLVFAFSGCYGQIINTIDSEGLYDVGTIVFDKIGNLYFNSPLGNHIGKIDTNHIVTIIAGNGTYGYFGDGGPATDSELAQPQGVVLDTSNNIYFADQQNQRIRKVDLTTGLISTVAGMGPGGPYTGGFSGDNGLASAAQLNNPTDISIDKDGNLYIADTWNYRIRKINTSGIITSVAGNGIAGKIGNDGPATDAEIYYPYFLTVDSFGNIYVASPDNTIRKINGTTGIINKFAGDTLSGLYNGDNIPATSAHLYPSLMTFNSLGLLTISDEGYNNRIRLIDSLGIIHTIAGNGIEGNSGDGGLADSAEIDEPSGIIFDPCGNLYIAQVNAPRVRKVSFNPSCAPLNEQEISEQHISISPNPATTEINISGCKGGEKYSLFNILGIMEQTGILNSGTNNISLKELAPGMYLVKIWNPDGTEVVKRVVKM